MPNDFHQRKNDAVKQIAVKTRIKLENATLVVPILSEIRLLEYLRANQLITEINPKSSNLHSGQNDIGNEEIIIVENQSLRAQPAQERFVVPPLAYSKVFADQLERFHLQWVHEAMKADDATSAHTLLETLYPTQEEKILTLTTRTYQTEINALEIGSTLLEAIPGMQQAAERRGEAVTKDRLLATLEQKKRQILVQNFTEPDDLPNENSPISWDGLMETSPEFWNMRHITDCLFDDKERRYHLTDDARRALLKIYAEYIQDYVARIEKLFSKSEMQNALPALWADLDKKRQQLEAAATLRRRYYEDSTTRLQTQEHEKLEKHLKKMLFHYGFADEHRLMVSEDAIDSDTELFMDTSSDEEEVVPPTVFTGNAPSLPKCYQHIVASKSLDELSQALTDFPGDFPGLATAFWRQLIYNIGYIQKDLRKEELPHPLSNEKKDLLRMQLAATIPNDFRFPLPVALKELNGFACHPTKKAKKWRESMLEGIGYFRMEGDTIIFTVKRGRNYAMAAHASLNWDDLDSSLFQKIFFLCQQKSDIELTKEEKTLLFNALEKKASTDVEPAFVTSLDHLDLMLISPFYVKGASRWAMYSLCKWLSTQESAIHLVKKWLLSVYMKGYPRVLDINQTYEQKNLLQSFFEGEHQDYSLLVHLLLLGAEPKEVPAEFYAQNQGLLLMRQSLELFHQKKMEYLIGRPGKTIIDRDFSVLLQQWRNLYQQQFFYLTGSHDNIARPCTTERKFPQEFKKMHRGLAGLLAGQGRRPGSDKSESNGLFYTLLYELYEKLMGVLKKTGHAVPEDNSGQSDVNNEFYSEMQNLYKKMGQALRQTSTVAGHDDALLGLTEEYKKITASWPSMPKAYEGWFQELRNVYQKTQNGSGSPLHVSPKSIYALKSTDPWFIRTREDLNHRVIRIQESQGELLLLAKWGEEALRNLSEHCGTLDTRLTETQQQVTELKEKLEQERQHRLDTEKKLEQERQERLNTDKKLEQQRLNTDKKLEEMMNRMDRMQSQYEEKLKYMERKAGKAESEENKKEVSDDEERSPYRMFG